MAEKLCLSEQQRRPDGVQELTYREHYWPIAKRQTRRWKHLHDEEFHNFQSIHVVNVIIVIKPRRIGLVGYRARVAEMRNFSRKF
jgi:hypothetical protein